MRKYHVACSLESEQGLAAVGRRMNASLEMFDGTGTLITSVSVFCVDEEPPPNPEEILILEQEIVRLIGVGIAFEQGHTMASLQRPLQPGPNTMRLAREKLEELQSAW